MDEEIIKSILLEEQNKDLDQSFYVIPEDPAKKARYHELFNLAKIHYPDEYEYLIYQATILQLKFEENNI
jgi:hypothetical protein